MDSSSVSQSSALSRHTPSDRAPGLFTDVTLATREIAFQRWLLARHIKSAARWGKLAAQAPAIDDLRSLCIKRVPEIVLRYFLSGSGEEISLNRNRKAFTDVELNPTSGVKFESVDLSTTVLGRRISMPIITAPVGSQRSLWPEGEAVAAEAAGCAGLIYGSVATLQEWSDMLRQCSLRHRFPVCSSGGNSNRKSSFWRLVGICVFPCRTGTSRSCSPSEVCTPITSRCGVGSSGMPQKWNDVCALGSERPTTVGASTRPTSGSRANGCILYRAVDSSGATIDFLLSAKRDAAAAERFLAKALRGENHPAPRVINTDKHAAYPPAIVQLKDEGVLEENCQHRPVQYLNNVLEQDHRPIKRRVRASQHFRSFWGAWRTIAGYEAIHMIRKGQACWSAAGAKVGLLHRFILGLFVATS